MAKRQDPEDGNKGPLDLMPNFAKELVAGGLAGAFAKTVVAPLERVKILFQVPQIFLPSLIVPILFAFISLLFIFENRMCNSLDIEISQSTDYLIGVLRA